MLSSGLRLVGICVSVWLHVCTFIVRYLLELFIWQVLTNKFWGLWCNLLGILGKMGISSKEKELKTKVSHLKLESLFSIYLELYPCFTFVFMLSWPAVKVYRLNEFSLTLHSSVQETCWKLFGNYSEIACEIKRYQLLHALCKKCRTLPRK